MAISYRVRPEVGFIEESWIGEIDAGELANHWRSFLSDPAVLALRRTLVDLTAATILFRGAELDELVEKIVLPRLGGKSWTTAIVVADPVQFGVSRQYQVFAERYSKDCIFSNREAAVKWLQAQESSD